jgi:putative ABC transport system permease protein
MNAGWMAELWREGARNLALHRLRSTLTLLGVVFGVGAVITMLGIGEGAQRTVLREIEGLGLHNLIAESVQPPAARTAVAAATSRRGMRLLSYGLTPRDIAPIRAALPEATLVIGHAVRQKVYCGNTRLDADVLGVSPEYFAAFRSERLAGGGLSALHERDGHRVAVVSAAAARALEAAPGGAVGRQLRVGGETFDVVGVVRVPGDQSAGRVYVPYTTARRLFGTTSLRRESGSLEYTRTEIGQVVIRLPDEGQVPDAAAVVARTLAQNHPEGDFRLTVPLDLLRSKQRTQRILNLVLFIIAAISLVVGGIGIMNIMLANVTERIPEIGVRRALGATQTDILAQFLTETLVLSTAGGVVGCALGFFTVPLASRWTGWAGVVTPGVVVASLGVSWLVGVFFGLAPAVRAAALDPVECLRHE